MVDRPERYREQNRRTSAAQHTALKALAVRYPKLYRRLYDEARAEIDRERGPLPDKPRRNHG